MNPPTPPASSHGGRGALRAAGVLALVLAAPHAIGVETLSNNLDRPVDGIEKVSNLRWLGSQFTTDNKTYLLTDVTLKLQRNIPGTFEAAIYSDAHGKPGTLIGVLDSKGQITGLPSNVDFQAGQGQTTQFATTVQDVQLTGAFAAPKGVKVSDLPGGSFTASGTQPSGLTLTPNTTYWIVMRAKSGEFASAYTDSEVGSGVGYSPVWAQSSNAGSSWITQPTSPLFLGVTGDPSQVIVELRTDVDAIQSAVFSALPTALVQRELVLSALSVTSRDVNERLFRLRAATESHHRGWEFFVTGGYGNMDSETVFPTTGFQSDVWAGTVGGEFQFSQHLTAGGAFTLVESNNTLGYHTGEVDLTGFALSAYLSYKNGGFYADALYQYARLDHDISRRTLFGETAHADPESENHVIELNLGYNIESHHVSTGPFVSATYTRGDLDGYTETGGATKNVRVGDQSYESFVTRVGWQYSMTLKVRSAVVIPQARIAWRHEFMDDSEAVGVALVQSPYQIGDGQHFTPVGSFAASSHTESPNRDSLEIGLGTMIKFSDRFALILDYEARVFQGDGVLHSITLTGNLRF